MLEQLERKANSRKENGIAFQRGQGTEVLGLMSSGIAHDLNNVLMIVSGNVELLRHEAGSDKSARLLDTIQRMTQRGKSLTDQLLSFASSRNVEPGVIDVASVVRELSDALKHCLRRDIEMNVVLPDAACLVHIDRGEFELAAFNLAVNARDAMPRGGSFMISVTPELRVEKTNGRGRLRELIAVRFSDSGTGIPAHLIPCVFEPFFTTKQSGKGTGLGLAQVYEFARQAGGQVKVSSRQQAGTTVAIFLPRVRNGSEAQ